MTHLQCVFYVLSAFKFVFPREEINTNTKKYLEHRRAER